MLYLLTVLELIVGLLGVISNGCLSLWYPVALIDSCFGVFFMNEGAGSIYGLSLSPFGGRLIRFLEALTATVPWVC